MKLLASSGVMTAAGKVGNPSRPFAELTQRIQISGFFNQSGRMAQASTTERVSVSYDGAMFCAVKDAAPAQAPLTSDCWQLARNCAFVR